MTFYKDFGDGWGTPSYSIEVQGETPAYLGVTWDLIGQLRNNIFSDWVFDQLPLIDRRDSQISVGPREFPPMVGSGQSIPELVPEVIRETTSEIFGEAMPLSDEAWFKQMFPDKIYAAPAPLYIEQKPEETDVGVFSDIYDQIDTGWGGMLPGGVPPFWDSPTLGIPNIGPSSMPSPLPMPTTSPVIIGPDGSTLPGQFQKGGSCEGGPYPVWKRVCGTYKWVMPKRRRRKQLATKGDIKSLAALKGVIGGGKSLDTWIATHS